jgi:hypothetical protein
VPTKKANIAKHVFEVLWREMNLMQVQLNEVMLECDMLHEQLGACQRKWHVLEQEVFDQQKEVEETLTRAVEVKNECLHSMENVICYN